MKFISDAVEIKPNQSLNCELWALALSPKRPCKLNFYFENIGATVVE